MRNIKITNNCFGCEPLENVPDDLKFVERIAKQHARTNEELKKFYAVGCKEAAALKDQSSPDAYKKNLIWTVRQSIIAEARK